MDVVQLVRTSDCGSESRGFESHLPPPKHKKLPRSDSFIFLLATKACFWKRDKKIKLAPACRGSFLCFEILLTGSPEEQSDEGNPSKTGRINNVYFAPGFAGGYYIAPLPGLGKPFYSIYPAGIRGLFYCAPYGAWKTLLLYTPRGYPGAIIIAPLTGLGKPFYYIHPAGIRGYFIGPLTGLGKPFYYIRLRVSGAILLRLGKSFYPVSPGAYIGLRGLENPSIIYTPRVSGGYFITPLQGLVIIYSVNPRFRRGSFLCFEILLTGSPEEQSDEGNPSKTGRINNVYFAPGFAGGYYIAPLPGLGKPFYYIRPAGIRGYYIGPLTGLGKPFYYIRLGIRGLFYYAPTGLGNYLFCLPPVSPGQLFMF